MRTLNPNSVEVNLTIADKPSKWITPEWSTTHSVTESGGFRRTMVPASLPVSAAEPGQDDKLTASFATVLFGEFAQPLSPARKRARECRSETTASPSLNNASL